MKKNIKNRCLINRIFNGLAKSIKEIKKGASKSVEKIKEVGGISILESEK